MVDIEMFEKFMSRLLALPPTLSFCIPLFGDSKQRQYCQGVLFPPLVALHILFCAASEWWMMWHYVALTVTNIVLFFF